MRSHRLPDPRILDRERDRYAGKRVLVVGTGHSAFNALVDLVALREDAPATEIVWAVRRDAPEDKLGGGSADHLPERGALGETVRRLVEDTGAVELMIGFQTRTVSARGERIAIADGGRELVVDEVIATTGFRPDLVLPETGVCNLNRAPADDADDASACCGAGSPHEEVRAAA